MPDLVAFYRREILSTGEAAISALIAQGIASGALSEACGKDDLCIFNAPAVFTALWMRIFHLVEPLDVDSFKDAHVRFITDALYARR